jgi:hydroxyacylglutathione hydrolase
LHPDDAFLHEMLPIQARLVGCAVPKSAPIDNPLRDDQSISFGSRALGVLHTPGHTPGSVCFQVAGADLCFTGDTLFAGGIGRTDLWGGDHDLIVKSIRHKLYALNSAVEVVPGHGPVTTIDRERVSNPFVRALD